MQDEITLRDEELYLTLGTKLEDNDFTDFEVQPSIRPLWSPEDSWAAWAAVSRAVRTPSRAEHDNRFVQGPPGPVVTRFEPGTQFVSEELIAYEIGYREQPAEWFSWDAAVFYNQYEKLLSFNRTPPGSPTGLPIVLANDNRGEGYGIELSAQAEMTPCWRISTWYSFLKLHIKRDPAISIQEHLHIERASPHNQVFLMSSHDLTDNVEFDLITRYVDALPAQLVPSYISLDLRLAWYPNCCTEFAVVGQNLLDSHHPEYNPLHISPTFPGLPFEIERGVYATVTRTW